MKKYLETEDNSKVLSERIRKDYFKGKKPLISISKGLFKSGSHLNFPIRKIIVGIMFMMFVFRVVAPETNVWVIPESSPIRPFSDLMYATAMVETMGNPLAYNQLENAVGIFQIRQVRVDEYNRLTGSKYVLNDMFERSVSEKVFLYFASQVGPYNLEKIAKGWNGSGPRTELYWKRIKRYL